MEFCREREFWSSEAFEREGRSGSEIGFAQAWGHWEIELAAKEKDTGTHERGWKGRWERRFKALPRVKLSLPFFKKTREKLLSHVQGSFILTHQALSWRGKWGWGGASWWCVMTGAFDPCSSSSFPTQLQRRQCFSSFLKTLDFPGRHSKLIQLVIFPKYSVIYLFISLFIWLFFYSANIYSMSIYWVPHMPLCWF